jgi:acyl-[acyl-carrier-protein]-phospholipid O-acyltransferase/long-chain-fatty-acid--[acyl-carrier-protein] ligase
MFWLKGPKIFAGDPNESEKMVQVPDDDWFQTGDLARFDEDGYLYIEGRVSRLSELWQMPLAPHDINDRID